MEMDKEEAGRSSRETCPRRRLTRRPWTTRAQTFFILSVPDFHIVLLFPFIEHVYWVKYGEFKRKHLKTRQSKHCGFCIYIFDNSFDQSKSMVRLVKAEKMLLSGLVFARKIARMISIQNIEGLMGPLMINMAFMPLYI